jgi:hypothetical protein
MQARHGQRAERAWPEAFDARAADRRAVAERDAGIALVPQLARVARDLYEARAWDAFGFLHVSSYSRERLRRSGRWLQDHAALGAAIARLPPLEAALLGRDGPPIGRVVATAIGRVATPATVAAWIDDARGASVRAILAAIRAARARVEPLDAIGDCAAASRSRTTLEEPEAEIDDAIDVRLRMPRVVAAAFEEVLDLHRAVSGCEAPVSSFIEALVAEAGATHVAAPARCDAAAAAAPCDGEDGISARVRTAPGESSQRRQKARRDPVELERRLVWLLRLESARERRLGRILYEMDRRGAWATLGFACLGEYAVERLGLARRTAEFRVGIIRALRRLPIIAEAYEAGRIGAESAWILSHMLRGHRVEADSQRLWVEHATRVTVKRLRDELRRQRLQELDRGADASAGRPPRPASDAEWYASLHRSPGRSQERLRALQVPQLETGSRFGTSADVCVRLRLPVDVARSFLAAIETARRRAEVIAAAIPWTEPWSAATAASIRAARAYSRRSQSAPSWLGLLALLEDYVEIWDDPRTVPHREWDATYARAGWRCEAPGCMARAHMEDHHVVYRSHRGSDELWNQLCLCRAHHRQGEHGDLARCRGRAPLGIVWRLGKNGSATWYRNETRIVHP